MVTPADIGWASYRQYEGPFFRGNAPFRLPASPTEDDLFMAVITATEGGHYNSYNGYDRCACTLGVIQWCDRGQFSVCDMLGHTAEMDGALIEPVLEWCRDIGVDFRKNARGRWRYFVEHAVGADAPPRGEVDRPSEQDWLYRLRSSGHRGTWDEQSIAHSKRWAAALASVYLEPRAQRAQVAFTVERLGGFVQKQVRPLFDRAPDTGLGRAFRAAYLSYAANNPTWAARHLQRATLSTTAERYSEGWLVEVLKELTFGPKVAIYPHRYDAIRPVLERHFGVDLPEFATELRKFEAEQGAVVSTADLQGILVDAGYDLGPAGVDGVYGPKTLEAMTSFQETHGLTPTGYPDRATRDALFAIRDALLEIDSDDLDGRTRRRIKALVGTTIADMARRAVNDLERARSGG